MKIFKWIALVVFLILIFVLPAFIKVRIECLSQYGECPAEINNKLQMLNAKFMITAKLQTTKILKQDFLVKNFSTQFKLPNILLINILVKKPEFAILDKSTNNYYLVDANGQIISKDNSSNLPSITVGALNQKIGDKISDNNLFALNLIAGIYQMYQTSTGLIQNDTLVVDLPQAVRVIFPLEGDSQVMLGGLRLIYTKVIQNYLGTYNQIDMRYRNPVLR